MFAAYLAGSCDGRPGRRPRFNEAVDNLRARPLDVPASANGPPSRTLFDEVEPFYQCTLLYVMAFFLLTLSWIGGVVRAVAATGPAATGRRRLRRDRRRPHRRA